MRLIDSEKLMIAVVDKGQASKRYGIGDFWELNYNEIKEVVDSMPTIDADPVIRCKDCKYHRGENACEKDGCYG